MVKTPRSVAVYARISSDQEGTGLGVTRQLEDCRALCERLGWRIGDEYVDNDISAYSGKRRPQYERMLRDVDGGDRDAVIVYHQDRLTRRPAELERFVDVVTAAGVRFVRFVSGPDFDPANGDGLLLLRVMGAVAANESATKSRRVKRKLVEVAESGRPHGGSFPPFGFESDFVTVVPSEAAAIRDLAERYLAGESLGSLVRWLEDNGFKTRAGGQWRTSTVRTMLCSARMAGLRAHNGVVVGPAVWEAILSPAMHDRLNAKFSEKARTGTRPARSYLLSGMLRCGRCECTLYSSRRQNKVSTTRRYVCLNGPDHRGCGKLTVVAEPVEQLVSEAVLVRLDSAALADALDGRVRDDAASTKLSESLNADRQQLDELSKMFGDREITGAEWKTARQIIDARIKDALRRLAQATDTDALSGIVGTPFLRERWSALNLDRQRAVVQAVLSFATVSPRLGARSVNHFDPARVAPHWRL